MLGRLTPIRVSVMTLLLIVLSSLSSIMMVSAIKERVSIHRVTRTNPIPGPMATEAVLFDISLEAPSTSEVYRSLVEKFLGQPSSQHKQNSPLQILSQMELRTVSGEWRHWRFVGRGDDHQKETKKDNPNDRFVCRDDGDCPSHGAHLTACFNTVPTSAATSAERVAHSLHLDARQSAALQHQLATTAMRRLSRSIGYKYGVWPLNEAFPPEEGGSPHARIAPYHRRLATVTFDAAQLGNATASACFISQSDVHYHLCLNTMNALVQSFRVPLSLDELQTAERFIGKKHLRTMLTDNAGYLEETMGRIGEQLRKEMKQQEADKHLGADRTRLAEAMVAILQISQGHMLNLKVNTQRAVLTQRYLLSMEDVKTHQDLLFNEEIFRKLESAARQRIAANVVGDRKTEEHEEGFTLMMGGLKVLDASTPSTSSKHYEAVKKLFTTSFDQKFSPWFDLDRLMVMQPLAASTSGASFAFRPFTVSAQLETLGEDRGRLRVQLNLRSLFTRPCNDTTGDVISSAPFTTLQDPATEIDVWLRFPRHVVQPLLATTRLIEPYTTVDAELSFDGTNKTQERQSLRRESTRLLVTRSKMQSEAFLQEVHITIVNPNNPRVTRKVEEFSSCDYATATAGEESPIVGDDELSSDEIDDADCQDELCEREAQASGSTSSDGTGSSSPTPSGGQVRNRRKPTSLPPTATRAAASQQTKVNRKIFSTSVWFLMDFVFPHMNTEDYPQDMNRAYMIPPIVARAVRRSVPHASSEEAKASMTERNPQGNAVVEELSSQPLATDILRIAFDNGAVALRDHQMASRRELAARIASRNKNRPRHTTSSEKASPESSGEEASNKEVREQPHHHSDWATSSMEGLTVYLPIPDRAMPFNSAGFVLTMIVVIFTMLFTVVVSGNFGEDWKGVTETVRVVQKP